MRPITLLLATALMLSPLASTGAMASPPGGGGGGGGNHPPESRVEGSGQRLHFSFGGSVRLKGNKAKGSFVLVIHPLAPQGTTLTVACKYKKFSQVTITAESATFRAEGRCERLLRDGNLEHFDAINVVQIVDGDQADSIDINFVGPTGVAVPGGTLDFGGFTLTPVA